MKNKLYSRRVFNKAAFLGLMASCNPGAVWSVEPEKISLDVYKDESCGCCVGWIEHMQSNSFKALVHHPRDLNAVKQRLGVPRRLQSCHTSVTKEGYVFEGHIPAKYIQQFLAAPPKDALGLAVPGMPMGSPGMDMGNRFNPYTIVLMKKDGSLGAFAQVENKSQQ